MIEIIKKKSTDFTDVDIENLYLLFQIIFHKQRTINEFKNQFLNTTLGYSFHAIAKDGEKIVGHNVYIPFRYFKNNEPFLLCLSVDAMIHPDYRGKGLYKKMLNACEEMAKAEGCKMRIGFPNDNSYPVQVYGFKYNDIGRLKTYCLPIKVGKLNNKLRFFNTLSKSLSRFLILMSNFSKSTNEKDFIFKKDVNDFNKYRYKWFRGKYEHIDIDNVKIIYKDSKFKGLPATFIMDIYPMNKHNFDLGVREVYKRVKSYSPIILYVGNIDFIPLSMIRIPHKVEPKHFHFVTKIFDKDVIGEESFDIKNWDLNLSNYDLL